MKFFLAEFLLASGFWPDFGLMNQDVLQEVSNDHYVESIEIRNANHSCYTPTPVTTKEGLKELKKCLQRSNSCNYWPVECRLGRPQICNEPLNLGVHGYRVNEDYQPQYIKLLIESSMKCQWQNLPMFSGKVAYGSSDPPINVCALARDADYTKRLAFTWKEYKEQIPGGVLKWYSARLDKLFNMEKMYDHVYKLDYSSFNDCMLQITDAVIMLHPVDPCIYSSSGDVDIEGQFEKLGFNSIGSPRPQDFYVSCKAIQE